MVNFNLNGPSYKVDITKRRRRIRCHVQFEQAVNTLLMVNTTVCAKRLLGIPLPTTQVSGVALCYRGLQVG
jgi:hypothetical protein